MKKQSELDWQSIRDRAAVFPDVAFDFIRDGLTLTVKTVHNQPPRGTGDPRHVSGQQLCQGLRELAVNRYGLLARTVLSHWNVTCTDDFGVMVYALIDRGELHNSENDSIDDFRRVYDFDEAFGARALA